MKLLSNLIPVLTLTSMVVPVLAQAEVAAPPPKPPAIVAPAGGKKVAFVQKGILSKGEKVEPGAPTSASTGTVESALTPAKKDWTTWTQKSSPTVLVATPKGKPGGQCDLIAFSTAKDAPYASFGSLFNILFPGGKLPTTSATASEQRLLKQQGNKDAYFIAAQSLQQQIKVVLLPSKEVAGQYRVVVDHKGKVTAADFYASEAQVEPFNKALTGITKDTAGKPVACETGRTFFANSK